MSEEKHTHVLADGQVIEHSHSYPHTHTNTKVVTDRLARAIGHLQKVKRMVEDGDMAPLTRKQYEKSWRLYIEPRWGDVQLDQVKPLQVQQWITTMTASPAGQAVSALGRIMDYAVRYELVDHNPMREKYIMPSKSSRTCRPCHASSARNVLRYHPSHWPFQPRAPPAPSSHGCSHWKSCGRSSRRHAVSSKSSRSAPSGLPSWNRQSKLNLPLPPPKEGA